jgi:hypothetical protein
MKVTKGGDPVLRALRVLRGKKISLLIHPTDDNTDNPLYPIPGIISRFPVLSTPRIPDGMIFFAG